MNEVTRIILCFIIGCLLGLGIRYIYSDKKTPINKDNIYQHKLDSLEKIIDILEYREDSIISSIDSSKYRVEVINHWYEKEFIDITNQSIADDVVFFTKYLSENSTGFPTSNNSNSVKTN